MRNHPWITLAGFVFLSACVAAGAQKFQPSAIEFTGAGDFSDQELMDAAGLKLGMQLSSDDVNAHAKQLMDSGMFASLGFRTDGDKLIIDLTPATPLYPLRLGSVPLMQDATLDARLRAKCPLYHGRVPGEGGVTDEVKKALEEMLADEKIKATVTASASTDALTNSVTTVRMDVASSPVVVGDFHEEAGSNALDVGALRILTAQTGSPFDMELTQAKVELDLSVYYYEEGYLEAEIHAKPRLPAAATATDIRVPFVLSVSTGPMYRIAGVTLAPEVVVTQAEFDRQSNIRAGDIADAAHVGRNWDFIRKQYHGRGMLKAKVIPTPAYDRDKGTVSYVVTVDPGPVYKMGNLTIENVTDDLSAEMRKQWPMQEGAVFDEDAALNFYKTGNDDRSLALTFASSDCKYETTINDDGTVDVVLRLNPKASR